MKQKEHNVHVTDYDITNYRLSNIENEIHHEAYAVEQEIMDMISSGNEKAISDFRKRPGASADGVGTMSYSKAKQEEYGAVVAISLFARAAIRGGLNEYIAYDLNDLFLQRLSETDQIEDYAILTDDALVRFVQEVAKAKSKRAESKQTDKVKQYIALHLNEKFDLKKLADQVNLTPNYLSALFSKSENMTIQDYLTRERIKAAKDLLKFSNNSVGEIAGYLGFSSSSHFVAAFKRLTGMTPGQYRRDSSCQVN